MPKHEEGCECSCRDEAQSCQCHKIAEEEKELNIIK